MKRETITQALGGLDDRFVSEAAVYAPGTMQEGPERIVRMKKQRFLSIVLAAALDLALGITAYAAWSTHAARQEEIKADLKIEENNVSSYAEYPVPEAANSTVSDVSEAEGSESELVLLSAVNAGEFQRVYVNISPVSEKCIADYPGYPGALNLFLEHRRHRSRRLCLAPHPVRHHAARTGSDPRRRAAIRLRQRDADADA